ncbi:alpha/beta hydrolase [Acidisoma cellulosilytica]|uniref:Alpha/beta hydrolase n=1 Tax=Acidisoma cellulosilyticum TaxID=2802395 RepID=A0A964E297_9PROT|nr:alpha/beta hydrolase [Acidisoma cellulosilyticum]MCB8879196.1 alpha/beta hydrolase [Acidisoma cellulosilyticum]
MRWLFLTLCALLPLTAHAAGVRFITVPADADGPPMTGAVWTPCAAPVGTIKAGPINFPGNKDCPILGQHMPLVVISHGVGGWSFGHHDLAETLADAGFVVAAIDHPVDGGRAGDRSAADQLQVWSRRPEDIRRLIDFMLAAWPDHARIDPARIGFFGFSRGGFTGLVLIGGNPDFDRLTAICAGYPHLKMCAQLRQGERLPEPLPHDPRIRAAVLADPVLSRIFAPAGLKAIAVPLQLWQSEYGGDGVVPGEVAQMAQGLPAPADLHVVKGAGHFDFLAPCGPDLARLAAPICTDKTGFDRVAFHAEMNRAILAFFQTTLVPQH